MKRLIAFSIFATIIVALIGCATVAKVTEKKPTVAPLARILVYVGDIPLGESGRSAAGTEMNKGGTVVFSAQGRDANGNPIAINPTWTPVKPGIIEITPSVGSKVTVRGLREGDGDFVVEADGVKLTVEPIRVR